MSKLSRQGWRAMFKLHEVSYVKIVPGKAGGLCSNYTGKAMSYVKNCPGETMFKLQGRGGELCQGQGLVVYVQITPQRQ